MKPFHRLLRRARIAWMVMRAAETAAVGGLIAAGVAIVAVGLLTWAGEPSMTTAAWILAVGVALGAIASLVRVPSRLAVAQRIDRQFGLHDLLSSALELSTATNNVDAEMRRIVLGQATAAAGRIPLTGVSFARLTHRAYAAAGIAAALVLTVSAIASPKPRSANLQATAMKSPHSQATEGKRESTARTARAASDPIRQPNSRESATMTGDPQNKSAEARAGDRGGDATAASEARASASAAAGSTREQSVASPRGADTVSSAALSERGVSGQGRRRDDASGDVSPTGEVSGGTPAGEGESPPGNHLTHLTPAPAPAAVPPAYRGLVRRFFARE